MSRRAATFVLLSALAGPAASGREATPERRRASPLTVAVLLAPGGHPEKVGDLEALLDVLIAREPSLVQVERGRLEALIAEQKLSLTGLADAREAARAGRLVQADVLLCAATRGDGLHLRVVETASAKVLAEEKRDIPGDVFLTARLLFEELLAATGRAPRLSMRLTVGIGAIYNETGTDRGDALGAELARLIRRRLRREGWAIVLERRYPTDLLAEVGLARAGLTSTRVDRVPPADVVVAGSFVEKTKEFAPGMEYPVSFRLVAAGGRRTGPRQEFVIDAVSSGLEAAADEAVRVIAEFGKGRMGHVGKSRARGAGEATRLFRAAQAIIPYGTGHLLRGRGMIRSIYATSDRQRADLREAIRLLENVLLLRQGDMKATMLLGRCLFELHKDAAIRGKGREQEYARKQCARALELIEQATRRSPSEYNATAFYWAASLAAGPLKLHTHGKRMIEYMFSHEDQFTEWQLRGIRENHERLQPREQLFEAYRRAVESFDEDPDRIRTVMMDIRAAFEKSPDRLLAFAEEEGRSENAYVRFWAERMAGRVRWHLKNPRAVEHFMRALELREEALARGLRHKKRWDLHFVDNIYRTAYCACNDLGMPDKAKAVLERGVEPFLEGGPPDRRTIDCARLLPDIYAEDGDAGKGFRLCDAVVRRCSLGTQLHERGKLIEMRARFQALSKGKPLPGFDRLQAIESPGDWYRFPELASAGGRIWVVLSHWVQGGKAYCYVPGERALRPLVKVGEKAFCLAAAGGRVCFGTAGDGIHVLDPTGRTVAHLSKERGDIPSDRIISFASTGAGRGDCLYFAFREADRYGVARFDPATLTTTVLAPTDRNVKFDEEPVARLYDVWWSPSEGLLWTGHRNRRRLDSFHGTYMRFSFDGDRWTKAGPVVYPFWIAACGDETLHASSEWHPAERGLMFTTMKLHPDKIILRSDDPLLLTVRDAAWDETRFWLPTVAGLYEVDRATGEMRCVAHKDGTPVYSILKDRGWLYLGAKDGIYRYRIR